MNRRRFLLSIFTLAGAAVTAHYGSKFYKVYKTPDLSFLPSRLILIDELAEVIIPRTDTPGAKDAKTGSFIVQFLLNGQNRKNQNNFIDGLVDLENYVAREFGNDFINLNEEEKYQTLLYFQKQGKNYKGSIGKINNKLFGKSFFDLLKEYTTIGYCTSLEGATKGLAYELVPGKYIADSNYSYAQKSWSTK